ncbi:MAG: sodium-dependent transporter [Bacteroidota bacterium]
MATARSGFSSRLGFVAAAAGSAVGLGNIWKFPYETADNGGGAFLFVYIICIFLIGFPVMVGEIAMGRKTGANPFGAYKQLGGKSWSWVGLLGVICGLMILSFYNVVAGWSFGYFLQISFGDLLAQEDHGAFFGTYAADIGDNFLFSLAFMLLTGFVVLRGIQKGIESASKILMPMLFAILIALIIYALTLPGAGEGVAYYLTPDFSKLNLGVLNSAMGQAFFSLSLGMGALITYGSYISKSDNITTSATIVTLADTSVAFLSGLLMLPLVFSAGLETEGGPGLVFTILPGIFQGMGAIAGRIVGGTFFLLLCVAALTSTISLLEVPVAYLVDERKWPRRKAVITMAAVIFLLGLPSMVSFGAVDWLSNLTYGGESGKSFLDLVADTFSEVGLPLGGMLMSIFIGVRWKTNNLSDEIAIGNPKYKGSWLETAINVMITYVCPVVLALIFVSNLLQKFAGVSIL